MDYYYFLILEATKITNYVRKEKIDLYNDKLRQGTKKG